jgi:4,4'-diaponeurosporenoate glycosyltransferase
VRVLSLGPYHDIRAPYEALSAMFNLMTCIGVGCFSLTGATRSPAGLFGPFLLVDRQLYEAVGGHAAVRAEILEHFSLGRLFREHGAAMACLGGQGVLNIRMYPEGLRSLVEGWTKAFARGAGGTPAGTMVPAVLWIVGGMLAFILSALSPFAAALSPALLLVYAAYAWQLHRMLRRIGRFPAWVSIGYPAAWCFFFVVFALSAFARATGREVAWKGRSISSR